MNFITAGGICSATFCLAPPRSFAFSANLLRAMIPFLERPVAHGRGMFMRVEKSFLPHLLELWRVDFSFRLMPSRDVN
jgi:hypothetical protein